MRTYILTLTLLFLTGVARAEPTVLAIEGKNIYVDLGARDGVGSGSELELLHEIVAKDPRTGKALRDHFALGTLSVVKSGDAICVAVADDELAKRVLAGDHVRLISAKRTFADPWAEQVAASKATPPAVPVNPSVPVVDHATLVRQAWQDTLGRPPEARIARWNELLLSDPKTLYKNVIEMEIASLRAQIAQREAALAKARSSASEDRDPRIARLASELGIREELLVAAPLARATPGKPLELAFLARAPIGKAWLYVRPSGEAGFRRLELQRDGDAYLRVAIDGALVRGPVLEWYVEVTDGGPREPTLPVLGSPQAPRVIVVDPPVEEAPIAHGRSQINVSLDYVDFQGKQGNGFDEYYQTEADFAYRFLDPIYSVRLGFGSLSGIGGPKSVIDAAPTTCLTADGTYQCKRVTFSYIFTELEFRLRPSVALLLRPQAGLLTTDGMASSSRTRCQRSDITGCDFATGFGGRIRLRLGEELATNLVIGIGASKGVGTLLEAAYHWLPTPMVPVQISVQVTDEPVVQDFGVRLLADVGLRKVSWFYPSLRVSYQARDINHTGVSGGAAMNFDW